MKNKSYLEESIPLIQSALAEDIKTGDITTDALIPSDENCTAQLISKEAGVIAGLEIFKMVFNLINKNASAIEFNIEKNDSEKVSKGDLIATIKGSYKTILTGERTALNFLQRMSGIATKTNKFVEAIKGTKAQLLDTRKTVPGFRALDKYSVLAGGGKNHRFGLYDMVMIKENHIRVIGSITEAIKLVRDKYKDKYQIEIETTNMEEVKEALVLQPDIIMLDNMSLKQMREAVDFIDGNVKTEASGNINLNSIRAVAETGVDFISVGSLTHSVKALDISLLII